MPSTKSSSSGGNLEEIDHTSGPSNDQNAVLSWSRRIYIYMYQVTEPRQKDEGERKSNVGQKNLKMLCNASVSWSCSRKKMY